MDPRNTGFLVQLLLLILRSSAGYEPGPHSSEPGTAARLALRRSLERTGSRLSLSDLARLAASDQRGEQQEARRVVEALLAGDRELGRELTELLDRYPFLELGPPPERAGEPPASAPSPPASWSRPSGSPTATPPPPMGRPRWRFPVRGRSGPERSGPERSAAQGDPYSAAPVRRVVSTGVVDPRSGAPLAFRTVLARGRPYRYWFAVGDAVVAGRVDVGAGQELPPVAATAGTRLRVIVFPFAGGLRLEPDATEGELQFAADGRLAVVPTGREGERRDRLEFPFTTPDVPGTYRLRSSVYLGTRLLQSRVLEVRVGRRQHRGLRRVIRSETDYTISESLAPGLLAAMRPPRVSILVNDGPGGTHDFRFVGAEPPGSSLAPADPVTGTATLDADSLGALLGTARRALGRAAWGTGQEWRTADPDRYATPRPVADVQADLVDMAAAGYRIWFAIRRALAEAVPGQDDATGGLERVRRLTELLRPSGALELASRRNLRLAVPSALVYDYPLDTGRSTLRFCPDAAAALADPARDLTREPCFDGRCAQRDELDVVCPGGFWGYRHELGVPLSLGGGTAEDLTPSIPGGDAPVFVVGTTTDPLFTRRLDHLGELKRLHVPMTWQAEDDRNRLMDRLRSSAPTVVYLLCHGIESEGLPALVVGDPSSTALITPDNFGVNGITWPHTRPLVVLNGCRTTALDPTKPLNFVETFLSDACASGVLGTEITVFEPLACDFAEEVLRRFVRDDVPLGRAVREARLALLQQGNPLGLAYVPYAPTELHLT